MKRFISWESYIFAFVLFLAVLAGCSNSPSDDPNSNTGNQSENTNRKSNRVRSWQLTDDCIFLKTDPGAQVIQKLNGKEFFMGRPLRLEYPGALYHITARGNERREIFSDEADR